MAAPLAASAADSVWNHAELQSQSTIAALANALQRLSLAPGSRTLILLSTGFLPPLQRQLETVVTGALRLGIVIHTLDVKGLDAEREGLNEGGFDTLHVGRTQMTRQTAFWEPLEKLADGTGGHSFHNNNNLAEQIEMAASPAVSYVLAFNPGARDGLFHALKITANDKSYSLQFRPGYASTANAPKSSNRAALDAAVFAKRAPREFPSNVALSAGQIADGLLPVSAAVVVDMNSIPFKAENGRHYQQIVFLITTWISRSVTSASCP